MLAGRLRELKIESIGRHDESTGGLRKSSFDGLLSGEATAPQ